MRRTKLGTAVAILVAAALFALSVTSFWEPSWSGVTRAVATSILVALLGFGGTLWIVGIMSLEK